MTDIIEPAFSIDLGPNGGQLSFDTFEDFEKWYQDEKTAWNWLVLQANQDGSLGPTRDRFTGVWRVVDQQIPALKNTWGKDQGKSAAAIIQNAFEQAYKNSSILYSRTPTAQFVFEQAKRNSRTAAYSTAYLTGIPAIHQGVPQSVEGIVEAFAFKNGLHKNAESERTALQELWNESNKLLEDGRNNRRAFESTWDEFQKGSESWLTDSKAVFKKAHDDWKDQFAKLHEDHTKAMKGIESAFNERIALEAPVTYWEQRKKDQKSLIRPYFWGLIAACVILTLSILGELWGFSMDTMGDLSKHIPRLVGTLILVTTLITLIRLAQRLFLSTLHVGTDADQPDFFVPPTMLTIS